MSGKHSAGKGDKYRPVDKKQYDENYEAIFGKKNKKKNSKKKYTKITNQLDNLFDGKI
jgi:hypothetical protein